jgi:hypothetical protein
MASLICPGKAAHALTARAKSGSSVLPSQVVGAGSIGPKGTTEGTTVLAVFLTSVRISPCGSGAPVSKTGAAVARFGLIDARNATVGSDDKDLDLVLDVDAALERLAREDPSSAQVARLRLFAGSSIEEAAEALGVSRATAFREWAYARSWLATALDSDR